MHDGEALHRTAAALRTALVGRVARRFDAPDLVGPTPGRGRVIESVESRKHDLDVIWDDGLVLHTSLRWSGTWALYRRTERWRHPFQNLSVAIDVGDWVAACFRGSLETYRAFDPVRHPAFGVQGPDVCDLTVKPSAVQRSLQSQIDEDVTIADALVDPRVVRGVGNVFRSEILFAAGIHPAATMSRMTAEDCAALAALAVSTLHASVRHGYLNPPMKVYGRSGRRCDRCGDTVAATRVETGGAVYFCPGCQTSHDPAELTSPGIERPMDPHPAASRYLAELPWRRDRAVG